ncbi:MAG: transposase [Deltaproteobacteria bacterium]|nr:transposase [Deltaproteobacteria bacterium]
MQWNVPKELTAEERRLVGRMRRRSKFYVFLRGIRGELFDDAFEAELMAAYKPRGQEPVPPALLAMVLLLQAYTGLSDADAVDEAEMDQRWQLVLGTLGQEQAPFGQGSLPRFRARLAEHDLDRRLVERTVELAKKTGAFGWQKLKAALDSSPLRGAGRVEDCWNLIGRAMAKMVDILAEVCDVPQIVIIQDAGLSVLQGPSVKAVLDIDWTDKQQRSDALQRVVTEGNALLTWARAHANEVMSQPRVHEAAALLERVLGQDTEPDPDRPGRVRIRKGVAVDRVCSVGDPDMRHGRKSSSKAFNGYKRYVASMVDVPLILYAEVRPANVPEQEAVPSLVTPLQAFGELESLYIDRGFLAHAEITRLDRRGVKVLCRPWGDHGKRDRFSKRDFRIDLRRRQVTCPAGQTVSYHVRNRIAVFGEPCGTCRLRQRCTESPKGRSVRVNEQESLLRRLAARSATKQGRKSLRPRVAVEHRLARVSALQTGRARYKGSRNNTLDLRRHAAVANLIEIHAALNASTTEPVALAA